MTQGNPDADVDKSKKDSEFHTRLNLLFSGIGAVCTVVGTLIAVVTAVSTLSPPTSFAGDLADSVLVSLAKFVVPSGYSVVPYSLKVIPPNSNFIMGVGESALLTQAEKVTFAVTGSSDDVVSIKINGLLRTLRVGEHSRVGAECSVWLYHIDTQKKRYSFQIRCPTDEKKGI